MSNTDTDVIDSQALERSVMGKIMNRLIPFLATLYMFCLMDRTNVSIAALSMQKALSFSDSVYGLGAGIFFLGYFIFEVPSNLIMERVGARLWIARIMGTWGLISGAMMFVHTPMSFYSLRFLLGVAEAGFYPGVLLYLTFWVPAAFRAQVLSRFLALTAILGLLGNPIGGLLLKLNGLSGLQGWQWLFFIEALPSVAMSLVVLRFLPDSPGKCVWLTEAEKQWLSSRLAHDAQTQPRIQHLSWRVLLTDKRIVNLCLIFIVTSTAINALGFFSPKLIKARSGNLWEDSFVAIIGVIPAIVGAVGMLLASYHSDRTGRRRLHVVVGYGVAALGILLCVFLPTAPGVVFALALMTLGERIAAGSYWAVTTNLMGARAAAGGLAFINSVGNLGGFIGPLVMGKLKDYYQGAFEPGLYVSAFLMLVGSVWALFTLKQRSEAVPNEVPNAVR